MIFIKNANKGFGDSQVILDVCIDVPTGSICAIVGPSGCGKSTLLNIACGLETLDSGDVEIATDSKPGYMLQDPLLLPWRNIEENSTLGMEVAKGEKPSSEVLKTYFDAVELWHDRSKYPSMVSGGMKQRVALVRTLLLCPRVLLLDEPFSSLDFDIKLKVQKFLLEYHRQNDTTILWVTHDIEDAIALSDQIIVLSAKPALVKARLDIDFEIPERNPIEARKSIRFLKYLNNDEPASLHSN
jgi:NitT/TauT family transport system ATP-binding protein